jgi:hypothetical protein
MKAIASGLHLCPGCCEKRIPAQRDLCYLCEALLPEEFAPKEAEATLVSPREFRDSLVTEPQRKAAKASGAIAFALLISSPFWLRALYEFFTGAMK